jgi:hypothetical protein
MGRGRGGGGGWFMHSPPLALIPPPLPPPTPLQAGFSAALVRRAIGIAERATAACGKGDAPAVVWRLGCDEPLMMGFASELAPATVHDLVA